MRKIKKLTFIIMIVSFALAALWTNVLAQTDAEEPEVVITFFWREGCSHCAEEKPFLQELADQNSQVVLKGYEVYYNTDNRDYFFALGEAIGFEANAVPVTVIGEQIWIGYSESVGEEIENEVIDCLELGCQDPAIVNKIDTSKTVESTGTGTDEENAERNNEEKSSFPVWIAAALLLVVIAYFVGRAKAKSKTSSKKKVARKRH